MLGADKIPAIVACALIFAIVLFSGCTEEKKGDGNGGQGNGADKNAPKEDGNAPGTDSNAPAEGDSNKTCWEKTPYGECGSSKPTFCEDGNLVEKCAKCGCPEGRECLENESCGIKPKSCTDQNGVVCDANKVCTGKMDASDTNKCCTKCSEALLECSSGTTQGSCASEKPKYCSEAGLVDKCSVCGCPSAQLCQADESCKAGDEKPTVKIVFTYKGIKYYNNIDVNAGDEFQLEVDASDDKGVSHIVLSDTSYNNIIENNLYSCLGQRICGNIWTVAEGVAGANTYTAKAVDTSEQEATLERTVTAKAYCGNGLCETGESASNCAADCQ